MGGSSGSESDSGSVSGRSQGSHKKEKKVKKDKKEKKDKKSESGDEHEKKDKKDKDKKDKDKKDKDKDDKGKKDKKDKKDDKEDKHKKDKKDDKEDKDKKDKKDKKDDDKHKTSSPLPPQISHALSGLGLGGFEKVLLSGTHGSREGGAPATGAGPAPTIPTNPSTGPETGASGQRIPCTTTDTFPAQAAGPAPPFVDSTGQPVYVGSALINGTNVQPCRITPAGCFIASDGVEAPHAGRYDLLPLTDAMEWVPASGGAPPSGKRVVEGGIENGSSLYHACARVNSVMLPGKAGSALGGAQIPAGGAAHFFSQDYFVLCWKE
ncbi:hypothetical protein RSOLAG22IIIB_09897 [Rhizoctonia solani]|uniref:Uncharacterized protein n=1 Tax=Rhizoctonia solani TaxID=456999 RepID=A0A0K6G061_9AGAM|nr:hypothetical protein RSOLAG22IIIB_09897 [Rhizoctonia solani]